MKEENKILLEVSGIKKYFPVMGSFGKVINNVKAVDDISFQLYKGETMGLVGETGCGKSTLGRSILKLTEPTEGKIVYDGEDISGYSEKQMRPMRKQMQMVFQDPYTSLNPRKRIGDILEEVLAIHKIGEKKERMDIAMETLHKVGLRPEHYYRYPHEFSGGQRQRVGLARALILNPGFVVCDEPVSALDVSIQAQIINLLQDLQRDSDLTYLFIAHDMSVVKYISTRIGVMYLGHLVEQAYTDDLFGMPMHPYTQALFSAVPETNPHVKKQRIMLQGEVPSPLNPPTGCVFHTRCPYAMPICKTNPPCQKEVSKGHFVACHLYDERNGITE